MLDPLRDCRGKGCSARTLGVRADPGARIATSRSITRAGRASSASASVHTITISARVDYPQTFWVEDSRFKLVQHGSLAADGRRARLDFEWLVPAGRLWRHVRETLWHVCWTDAEIRHALRKAGFELVRHVDGFDVRPKMPGVNRGTDAYYLARKTTASRK